jgi:hypothetical protein
MKTNHAPVLFLTVWAALAVLMGWASPAHADMIKSTKEWRGQLEDEKLEKERPAKGFVTNKEDFAKLWKAWMGKEKLPEIDFDKELVVVVSSSKGVISWISLLLIDGDAKTVAALLPMEVKGFTFALAVFKREGIKTIGGKPIEK